MCIIVYKKAGIPFPESRLTECAYANPDGWGMMWVAGQELFTYKTLEPWKFDYRFVGLESYPVVIHFRTASVGQITQEACHPHRLNDYLAWMHNGNLFHFSDDFYPKDGLTDSQRFTVFLKNFFRIPDLEQYFRLNYSKAVFMDALGQIRIVNEQAGIWEDGCWYSNGGIEHYIGYGYSGAYAYSDRDVRHKGGVLNIQGFPNSSEWHKCEWCEGWFYKLEDNLCDDCKAFGRLYESIPSN